MKYAYTKKNGNINNKFAMEDLSTINPTSYDEIVEVDTAEELKIVEVYKEPIILTDEQEFEQMIVTEQRELAVESLKTKGKIAKVDGKLKKKV